MEQVRLPVSRGAEALRDLARRAAARPAPSQAWFDLAPVALLVLESAGEVHRANVEAERLFETPRNQLEGRRAEDLLTVRGGVLRLWAATAPAPVEVRAWRADGAEFPAEVTVSRMPDGLLLLALRDVTEVNRKAQALAHRASHDALTGLPNRALFLDRLEHAMARGRRSRRQLAVIFVDLDNFRKVNNEYGHEAGDRLLLDLAPRLIAALRPGDTIARFGGDEFVVLCEELDGEADALSIAERILSACRSAASAGERHYPVTASVGVAMVRDPASATMAELLRQADAAMYRAKDRGKGRIELFDDRLRAQIRHELVVEGELRRAVERSELRLEYQPVLSLSDTSIAGVEALLRWQHPDRGLLEAEEFIDIACRSGLIVPIGDWVLTEACQQAAAWNAAEMDRSSIYVSVSLSRPQLLREDLAECVQSALLRSRLEPRLLELAVSETTLRDLGEPALRTIRELCALGVRLALDDFGTDSSSLGFLKRLAVDALKIDGSLIETFDADHEEDAVASAVLALAGRLDVEVIAEGIETPAQLERLRAEGCQFGQGRWLARPVSSALMRRLISERWVADYAARP